MVDVVEVKIIAMRCRKCGLTMNTPTFMEGQAVWDEHNTHGPILFIRAIDEKLDAEIDQDCLDRQMEALYRGLK